MVFRSQAKETKTAILKALKKHSSAENAVGYNKLFDMVHKQVGGSRRTFQKYLSELVTTQAVKKETDPRHKTGVIIYLTEDAARENILLDLVERVTEISKMPPILKQHPTIGRVDMTMLQLSNELGRLLSKMLLPNFTYAYARITGEGANQRVTLNFLSEDKNNHAEICWPSDSPVLSTGKSVEVCEIGRNIGAKIPLPPDKEIRNTLMDELREACEVHPNTQKIDEVVTKALSFFSEEDRQIIVKSLYPERINNKSNR
jgi:hypothetical protein